MTLDGNGYGNGDAMGYGSTSIIYPKRYGSGDFNARGNGSGAAHFGEGSGYEHGHLNGNGNGYGHA